MKTSRVFQTLLPLPLMISASLAMAQDQADEGAAEGTLEEVMVTATRRGEQDIMTTPISITALDGEEVQKFALRDLNDIAVSVPGLSSGTVSSVPCDARSAGGERCFQTCVSSSVRCL